MRYVFAILTILVSPPAFTAQEVSFFTDSILRKDGDTVRLLGGTTWELSSMSLVLVAEDVVLVFKSVPDQESQAIMYHGGMEISARHIRGLYRASEGSLARVVAERGDGAILELDDGTILTIPDYDQYDTGWWLPPYPVIVTKDRLYMWNLKEGKRVWIDGVK